MIIPASATIRTKDYYLALRNRYRPEKIKTIFVLESPPASGLYFYNPSGSTNEPLFKAMMRDVLGITPTEKKEGLEAFKAAGFFLIDSTYTPVNKLGDDEADEIIRRDFPLLISDLHEHPAEKGIVLVKVNVCELEPKLKEIGFNVLNHGIKIPFPDRFHTREFRDKIHQVLRLN